MPSDQPAPRLVTTESPGMPPGWSREAVELDGVLIGYLTCQHYASDGGGTAVRYFPADGRFRTAGDQKGFPDRGPALDAIIRAHHARSRRGR